MKIDLTDKTALVTGAGSGIGLACARALAAAGAFVWVNDQDAAKAEASAAEIGGAALPGDVAEPGDWLRSAIERDVLHILVHNAGYDLTNSMGSTERSTYERLVAVQMTGPFEITQRLLPALKNAEGAAVIHIASVHARATEPGMSAYASVKAAQVAMLRSLAQELGPYRIRALSVSPGFIETPLIEAWLATTADPAATRAHSESLHPLGRLGTPEDVANLVAFLASPYAEFINGTDVVVDGGLLARLF